MKTLEEVEKIAKLHDEYLIVENYLDICNEMLQKEAFNKCFNISDLNKLKSVGCNVAELVQEKLIAIQNDYLLKFNNL